MDRNFVFSAYLAPPPKMQENSFDESIMARGYELLKLASFDYAYGYYEKMPEDESQVVLALDYAAKNNIKYLVTDKNFSMGHYDTEGFRSSCAKYASHSAFGGVLAFDEPSFNEIEKVKKMHDIYRDTVGKGIFYVNMQPIDSPLHFLVTSMWSQPHDVEPVSYVEYLEKYIEVCSPEFLSFDFYPFLPNGGVKPLYFKQLITVAAIAKKHNIPLWAYVQSCSWSKTEARVPTYSEVCYNVNTLVAFGATGLQYFCYFTPYSNGIERKNVAMIDFDSQPTERYNAAKSCNEFLKSIETKIKNKVIKNTIFVTNAIIGEFESGELFVVADNLYGQPQKIVIADKDLVNYEICFQDFGSCKQCHGYIEVILAGGEAAFIVKKGEWSYRCGVK